MVLAETAEQNASQAANTSLLWESVKTEESGEIHIFYKVIVDPETGMLKNVEGCC